MPAVSKSQQRYFGYLLSNPDERKKEGVTKKVAKEFAGTKHKGLPEKVKEGIDTAILESAWQRKEGKNPSGWLNEKGRKSYERENPGSDLKAPQAEGGSRKKSFCARMGGVKGPMKDEKGRPTRKALALRKWKCSEEYFGLEATLDVQRIRSGYVAEDAPTMSAGSSPAGFSGDAEAEGPVAGLDQPLGGTQKMAAGKGVKKTLKYKCKKTKDGVNQMSCPPGVEPFKEENINEFVGTVAAGTTGALTAKKGNRVKKAVGSGAGYAVGSTVGRKVGGAIGQAVGKGTVPLVGGAVGKQVGKVIGHGVGGAAGAIAGGSLAKKIGKKKEKKKETNEAFSGVTKRRLVAKAKDKKVGKGERIGSVAGGIGGAVALGSLDGPLPIGDVVGGVVGSKIGGKIGKQFDKKKQKKIKEAYDPKYLSFKVCIDDGNIEFIYYGKSPADVKIQLRKIYRPEQLKKVKIERLLPGDVMKFYWNKRQAVM